MIEPLFKINQTVYVVTKATVIKGTVKNTITISDANKTEVKYGIQPWDSEKVFNFNEDEIYAEFAPAKIKLVEAWEISKKKYDELFENLTEASFEVKPEETEVKEG